MRGRVRLRINIPVPPSPGCTVVVYGLWRTQSEGLRAAIIRTFPNPISLFLLVLTRRKLTLFVKSVLKATNSFMYSNTGDW